MPPRRRPPASSSTAAAAAAGAPSKTGVRPSKLAKEHKITAEEESEIREAFSLFSEPMAGEKEGIMPIGDVRRALIALNLPPSSPHQLSTFTAALDPDDEGFATYPAFVGICALQIHARRHHQGEAEYEEEHRREVDEAYALFTEVGRQAILDQRRRRGRGGHDVDEEEEDDYTGGGGFDGEGSGEGGEEVVITMADLRRVAALLRLDEKSRAEDAGESGGRGGGGGGNAGFGGKMGKGKDGELVVTEELLRDMILEANGGAGVGRGVRKAEFDEVMRRAGVWR